MPQSRQLAAILFTDFVGYTASMHANEHTAVALIKHYNTALNQAVSLHNGKVLNNYGDGSLCTFLSATEAVNCAIQLQKELQSEPNVPLRIGLHVGEVLFEEDKVLGDGVNVASRIQSLGQANTILFSREIFDKIRNQPGFKSVTLGFFEFKNVDEPMEVFALANEGLTVPKREQMEGKLKTIAAGNKNIFKRPFVVVAVSILLVASAVFLYKTLNDHPKFSGKEKSIAVLPFTNMSNDKENRYFAEGMMDEILNRLSKIKEFKVISRTSVEQYRDTKKTTGEIAKELGVAYILEGSAQKYGDQIKVLVQLIHGETGYHEWSGDYIKTYKEVFALHADIANNIANELQAKLSPQENELINKAATANLEAYDFYLRGREYINKYRSNKDERDLGNARTLFQKALEVDPEFAWAWAGLGLEYNERNWNAAEFLKEDYLDSVLYYCNKALSLDANLSDAYWIRGRYYQNRGKYDNAIADEEKAISIDPNNSAAYWDLGEIYLFKKNFLKSLSNYKKCNNLIKGGTELPDLLAHTALVHVSIGNFQAADSLLEKAIRLKPDFAIGYGNYAWSLTVQGKLEKALIYTQKMAEINPNSQASLGSLSDAYAFLKDFANALKYLEKEEVERKKTGDIRIHNVHRVGYILWNTGKKEEAGKYFNEQITTLEEAFRLGRSSASTINYDIAATYAFLGEHKKALEHLQAGEKEGFNWGTENYIMVDPLFESLRNNNEFKEIVERAQAKKAAIRVQLKELEMKGAL